MNNFKIICISGYKGSGKDTVSNYIAEKYNYEHKKLAQPIKDITKLLFNLTDRDVEEDKELVNKEWNIKPRILLQKIGTEMFQYELQKFMPDIGRNFWIIRFIKNINKDNLIVISDLRFIHEYEMLKKYCDKIKVIKIEKNNIEQSDTHISENEFDKIPADYIIKNNSSFTDLYTQIDNILEKP